MNLLQEVRAKVFNGDQLEYNFQFPDETNSVEISSSCPYPLSNQQDDSYYLSSLVITEARRQIRKLDLNNFIRNYKKFLELFYFLKDDSYNTVNDFIIEKFTLSLEKLFLTSYEELFRWFVIFFRHDSDQRSKIAAGFTVTSDGFIWKKSVQFKSSCTCENIWYPTVDHLISTRLFEPLSLPDNISSDNIMEVIETLFPGSSSRYSTEFFLLKRRQNSRRSLDDRVAEMGAQIQRLQDRMVEMGAQIQRLQDLIDYQRLEIQVHGDVILKQKNVISSLQRRLENQETNYKLFQEKLIDVLEN